MGFIIIWLSFCFLLFNILDINSRVSKLEARVEIIQIMSKTDIPSARS